MLRFTVRFQRNAQFEQSFLAHNEAGIEVNIPATRELEPGQSVDLTEDIPANYDFFTKGAGYWEGWEKGVTVDDPESVAEE
jgi:hypothetical protein